MTIAQARVEARRVYAAVKAGADPIAEARRDRAIGRAAQAGIGTLQAILDAYSASDPPRSWERSRRVIVRVFKPLVSLPIATMTTGDLQLTADRYHARPSAHVAVRALRPILKWAAKRNYLDRSLADLQAQTSATRQRRLTHEELAAILPVLQSTNKHNLALCFMLLTLCRLEEAVGATWNEINLDVGTWTLPRERVKTGQPHIIDLPRQAIDLLKSIKPSPMNPGAFVFISKTGTKLSNWDRATKRVQAKSNTSNWHRHDLRRTGATMLGEMGVIPDFIEAALNHATIHSSIAAIYNRARYRPEVAGALQRLADMLDGIAAGAEVIPLRA